MTHLCHSLSLLSRDSSTDVLSYWCGWLTVLCSVTLLLTSHLHQRLQQDPAAKEDVQGTEMFVSVVLIVANLAIIATMVHLQRRKTGNPANEGEGTASVKGCKTGS